MKLLLIAQSARFLAQSACRAGWQAAVIDGFLDWDTCQNSQLTRQAQPQASLSHWLQAAAELAPPDQGWGLIYASGIDTRPDLVEALAQGRILLGNSPDVLRVVHQPQRFFQLLQSLQVPYPETRFDPPENPAGWLVKPGCGEGGKGVGFAAKICTAQANGAYFQRYIPGPAYSALFLADGTAAILVGINRQWSSDHDPTQPFLFAGAVNRVKLTANQHQQIETAVQHLTQQLGLVGINSLDFVLTEERCLVLELNPRPSATMALYEADFASGIVSAHQAACMGKLIRPDSKTGTVHGFRYLFAAEDLVIPDDFQWPKNSSDLPNPGSQITAGQPICSLMAEGLAGQSVEVNLHLECDELSNRLCGLAQGKTRHLPHSSGPAAQPKNPMTGIQEDQHDPASQR